MTQVFAHRGSGWAAGSVTTSAAGPGDLSPDAARTRENTVAGFQAAGALGADGVELDVRLTADGALAVHHDATVPEQGGRAIAQLQAGELPGWLPLLADALGACAGLVVNVEVKADDGTAADPVAGERTARAAADECRRWQSERPGLLAGLVISSFSRRALDAAAAAAPELELAWLVGPSLPSGIARAVELAGAARSYGYCALHPFDTLVDGRLVEAASEQGLPVRVWTVDQAARVADLGRLGVAGVITNDVATARRALGTSP